MDAPFGTLLKRRFDVLGELGRGGQGVVYRVRPKGGSGDFALKFVDAQEDAGRLFESEEIAATLHHPNIVALHAIGADQDESGQRRRYVVYEIVPGSTLARAIGEGPLTMARAVELAFEVLAGLAHAHALGIAHLDVKPANILLSKQGHAKIADFGLGRWVGEEDQAPFSGPQDFGGTPAYCAPEQILGEPRRASDVYAFGMMFHEMLTGKAPFGDLPVPQAVQHQLHATPPPPGVNPDLDHFVAQCVAKAPEMRFPHAGAALEALRQVAQRLHLPVPLSLTVQPPRALALASARGLLSALPRLSVAALWLAAPLLRTWLFPRLGALAALAWLAAGAALAAGIGRKLESSATAALTWSLSEALPPHLEKAAAACALALAAGLPAPPAEDAPPLLPFTAAFQVLAGWLFIGAPLRRWVEDALENPDRTLVILTVEGAANLRVQFPDGAAQALPLTRVMKPGTYRVTVTGPDLKQELVLTLPEPGSARLSL